MFEDALEALGVTVWKMVEVEADDALGAAAAVAAADDRVEQVIICTPDKDLGQCVVGDRVVQLDRRKDVITDEDGVIEKFGVGPASIPDYLALVGDTADGFPGLQGWGAKSAARVLARWGHRDIPARRGLGPARAPGAEKLARPCRTRWPTLCCSGGSPRSNSTSRSARSTTGSGPGRPIASPRCAPTSMPNASSPESTAWSAASTPDASHLTAPPSRLPSRLHPDGLGWV
ncbi:MAG: hypothetical protein R2705_19305 [Ilumatobacteraceae bacterium]